MGTPDQQADWLHRLKEREDKCRAEQALIPDPDQSESQTFGQVVALYEAHTAQHPKAKGYWLIKKRDWGHLAYAARYGTDDDGAGIWCRIWITGQIAGKLPYAPPPITVEEMSDTDWYLFRKEIDFMM